jgi:release factor glutamine methyltransferase
MTIREHITAARARLISAGIDLSQSSLDPSLLARHLLGWDTATLFSRDREEPPAGFEDAYRPLIDRRVRREPVAYIRGVQEFWGRDFEVSPAVLIPRPETELIIEELMAERARFEAPFKLAVDVGTGSGCLAVTMAAEIPGIEVVATDASTAALDIARRNAQRHHVSRRVEFLHGRYLAGARGPFDVIVSNPPYVTEPDYTTLQPEVRDHEPASALVAGPDGLRDIREIVRIASTALARGGLLVMEFGYNQAADVEEIVMANQLKILKVREDLQRIPRVIVAERPV